MLVDCNLKMTISFVNIPLQTEITIPLYKLNCRLKNITRNYILFLVRINFNEIKIILELTSLQNCLYLKLYFSRFFLSFFHDKCNLYNRVLLTPLFDACLVNVLFQYCLTRNGESESCF